MKTETLIIKVDTKQKAEIKANAKAAGAESMSAYVRSRACNCGESGHEGIFYRIEWKCVKCGKVNTWKK